VAKYAGQGKDLSLKFEGWGKRGQEGAIVSQKRPFWGSWGEEEGGQLLRRDSLLGFIWRGGDRKICCARGQKGKRKKLKGNGREQCKRTIISNEGYGKREKVGVRKISIGVVYRRGGGGGKEQESKVNRVKTGSSHKQQK